MYVRILKKHKISSYPHIHSHIQIMIDCKELLTELYQSITQAPPHVQQWMCKLVPGGVSTLACIYECIAKLFTNQSSYSLLST